jgi:hypothetical protein
VAGWMVHNELKGICKEGITCHRSPVPGFAWTDRGDSESLQSRMTFEPRTSRRRLYIPLHQPARWKVLTGTSLYLSLTSDVLSVSLYLIEYVFHAVSLIHC